MKGLKERLNIVPFKSLNGKMEKQYLVKSSIITDKPIISMMTEGPTKKPTSSTIKSKNAKLTEYTYV